MNKTVTISHLKCVFLNKNLYILVKIVLKLILRDQTDNKSALV